MIFCSTHGRLFLPHQQVWITSPREEVPTFLRPPQTIETACDRCVEIAKEELKLQFPALYVHATKLPS